MTKSGRSPPKSGLFSLVAAFVHDIKIATNNYMNANRDLFPHFEKWEHGYCALTYSESEKEQVIQYIIHQKKRTFAGWLSAVWKQ
jgi:REP element-mobilizing transposase RayT